MHALLRGMTWRRLAVVAVDHVLIVAAVLIAAAHRVGPSFELLSLPLIWRAMLIALVLQICLHYRDLYDSRTLHDRRNLIVGLLEGLGAGGIILALLYYFAPVLIVTHGTFAVSGLLIVAFVSGWRLAFEWLSGKVGPRERIFIVGTNSAAVDLARELHELRHELGVELVGFIDVDPNNPIVIGTPADIPRLVREYRVDRVVVSLADARGKFPMDHFLDMKLTHGVRFDHLASVYSEYTGKIAIENLRPSWLIFSEGFRKSAVHEVTKRLMDIILASIGIVLLSPVILTVAALVRLTSPGPAFFHQRRVGRRNGIFTVHKFRSMRQDAEKGTGAVWAQKGDPRVTTVGRLLRRTRLDEVPQLWNVLKGDMSLVGPRPERPEFVSDLQTQIPFYGQRHVVRPGVTGWAQVRYAYGASVEDSLQKLQYDLYYIQNQSIIFDVLILLETIKTALVRRGS